MSVAENKRLVKQIFDELAKGNTQAFSAAMSDDFRWVFPGHWSWSGTWERKDVVLKGLLHPLFRQFDGYRSQADLLLADGDRVVVQARGTGKTTRGDSYNQSYCYIFRIAEGRITEVIEYCDTALVERVLERVGPPTNGRGSDGQ